MIKTNAFRNSLFGALFFFASAALAQAAVFPDVVGDNPNAVAIDYLSREGIISGYPDGTFRPENSVNRAEALKILLLASGAGIQNPSQDVFPDVPKSAWFAPFVFSGRQSSVVAGYPDGTFRPEQTVNLVEALKILLNANSVPLENYSVSYQLFADSEKNAWYNPFLFYAQTFELVDPDAHNKVFPATPLTRGALAEIVYRFRTRIENACPRMLGNAHTISPSYFRGLTLATELPNVFYENEIFILRGSLASPADSVSAVLESRADKTQKHFTASSADLNFAVPISFAAPGSYNFSVIPVTTNSNSAVTIDVLPRECAPATAAVSGSPPISLTTSLVDNKPTISWVGSGNNIFRLVIRQGQNRVEKLISVGQNSVALDPADFRNFTTGSATFQVFSARSTNGWSFEPRSDWLAGEIATVNLGRHYFSTFDQDKLVISNLPTYRSPRLSLSATAKTDLESEAYLINPRGKVEVVPIVDADKISAGETFGLNLQLPEEGIYFLEINGTNGIAVLNHPLYFPGELPLLPDFDDLREQPDPDAKISLTRERAVWLKLVNDFRAQQQLSKVNLDEQLSAFAQNYADQMASQNFFGHIDPAGRDPEARRKLAGLALPVGENLARDSKTEYAHEGLLRSPAHRENILAPEWTRVGLGVAKDPLGRLIFVQEFSADPLTAQNLSEFKSQLLGLINARRAENSASAFATDSLLEPSAQAWSAKMVAENFTAFTKDNDSLENFVRAAGYSGGFASFIVSAGQLAQIVEGLSETTFTDSAKTKVAIGLAQSSDGRIIATLIFR
ncbi:MAG: CAP domain-containing protein [Patescibacteria group bacterium]